MGDQDQGRALFLDIALHQPQDLRLNGHIKPSGRLVSNDQTRLCRHGDGGGHALPDAARKLMGIALQTLFHARDAGTSQPDTMMPELSDG